MALSHLSFKVPILSVAVFVWRGLLKFFFGHRTNHSSAELSMRQIYTELLSKRPWQTGGSDCTAQRVSLCLWRSQSLAVKLQGHDCQVLQPGVVQPCRALKASTTGSIDPSISIEYIGIQSFSNIGNMGPCVVCPITLMGPEHVLPVAWEPASESDVYWLVVSTI